MLPVVVEAVTKSAEGSTASAAAIQNLEAQIVELKGVVSHCHGEIKRIADAKVDETEQKRENGKTMRALLKPETVYYTIVLILTALGFRLTIPTPVQNPLPVPVHQTTQQGELP